MHMELNILFGLGLMLWLPTCFFLGINTITENSNIFNSAAFYTILSYPMIYVVGLLIGYFVKSQKVKIISALLPLTSIFWGNRFHICNKIYSMKMKIYNNANELKLTLKVNSILLPKRIFNASYTMILILIILLPVAIVRNSQRKTDEKA